MKKKGKQRIAIDLVPIRVGKGGTGSGIWTYARELILHMDTADLRGLEVIGLVNSKQISFFPNLLNIRLIRFPEFGKHILYRLLWIHLLLPLLCIWHRIGIVHKLATEIPLVCPVKRVTTVHDFYYEFLMRNHSSKNIRLYERVEKLYFSLVTQACFRKSRAIIVVSNAIRQEAISRYPLAADRVHVVYHGASQTQDVLHPFSDKFNILCVAKFMEHKGQHLLINAFETLLEKMPELAGSIRLILRGFQNDEDYYRRIKKQIYSSYWAEYIKIVPFCPSDHLEEIYKGVDLVVLLSDYEGFGLPVLEAQGEGIPILCSNLPVLREVGGEGAVYVDREDKTAVVNALLQLINNPDYYVLIREKAKANIQRFSWNETVGQTLEIYRKI